jgi:hypothetical protein
MKKIFILILCINLWSCNDGDLDIPAFEFEEQVYGCDIKNGTYTLFKMGVAEAIIITLPSDVLREEVTTVPFEVLVTTSNVVYRTFSSKISASYFCNDIPPVVPTISSNWTGVPSATSKILIETVEDLDFSGTVTGYVHQITFENLKVESGSEYISFENAEFGKITIEL